MTIPVSYQSTLVLAIYQWLNDNTSEIVWGVYDPITAKTDPPSGAVTIKAKLANISGSLLGNIVGDYDITIAVQLPGEGRLDALLKAYDAEEYLRELVCGNHTGSLRANGISGTFGGRNIKNAFRQIAINQSYSDFDAKQDSFALAHAQLRFTWTYL